MSTFDQDKDLSSVIICIVFLFIVAYCDKIVGQFRRQFKTNRRNRKLEISAPIMTSSPYKTANDTIDNENFSELNSVQEEIAFVDVDKVPKTEPPVVQDLPNCHERNVSQDSVLLRKYLEDHNARHEADHDCASTLLSFQKQDFTTSTPLNDSNTMDIQTPHESPIPKGTEAIPIRMPVSHSTTSGSSTFTQAHSQVDQLNNYVLNNYQIEHNHTSQHQKHFPVPQ